MAYFECCTFNQMATRFLVLRNIVCQCWGLDCVRHSYGTFGPSESVTLWKTLGTTFLKLYDADNFPLILCHLYDSDGAPNGSAKHNAAGSDG